MGAIRQPNCTDMLCSYACTPSVASGPTSAWRLVHAAAVFAVMLSHLDYANSLLMSTPEWMLQKLQVVQNNEAKLVFAYPNAHVFVQ